MNCPVCSSETKKVCIGVVAGEFDYCPQCREDVVYLRAKSTPLEVLLHSPAPSNKISGLNAWLPPAPYVNVSATPSSPRASQPAYAGLSLIQVQAVMDAMASFRAAFNTEPDTIYVATQHQGLFYGVHQYMGLKVYHQKFTTHTHVGTANDFTQVNL